MDDSRMRPPLLASTLLVAAGFPLLASVALAWIPALHQRFLAAPPVCWSRLLLHRDCAGCGLTRSFVAIAGGELSAGVRWNPLGPVLYIYLCTMALSGAAEMLFPRLWQWRKIEAVATVVVMVWAGVDVVAFYFG